MITKEMLFFVCEGNHKYMLQMLLDNFKIIFYTRVFDEQSRMYFRNTGFTNACY